MNASQLSATEKQRAANAITYFNHRSVGNNILDHINYWGTINVRSGTGTARGINHTEEGNNASHLSKLRAFESNVRAGHQIATGPTPTVNLVLGYHLITLTVTDNDGYTDSDDLWVQVLRHGGDPFFSPLDISSGLNVDVWCGPLEMQAVYSYAAANDPGRAA